MLLLVCSISLVLSECKVSCPALPYMLSKLQGGLECGSSPLGGNADTCRLPEDGAVTAPACHRRKNTVVGSRWS